LQRPKKRAILDVPNFGEGHFQIRTARSQSPLINTDWSEGVHYLDLGGVLTIRAYLGKSPERPLRNQYTLRCVRIIADAAIEASLTAADRSFDQSIGFVCGDKDFSAVLYAKPSQVECEVMFVGQ
jgi:hypothetical protein